LDVEHLAAQGQNRLKLAVAALLGGAAGRVTFDDVELAKRWVFFLAVGKLAGQANTVEYALAARHFAGLVRGIARTGSFYDLAAYRLGVDRVFLQKIIELGRDDVFDRLTRFAGDQLHLGLRSKLGIGHLYRQHAGQAFAHVVTGDIDLGLGG